jgi:Fic family protein
MKLPLKPPALTDLYKRITAGGPDRLMQVMLSPTNVAPNGNYRHWDTLRHLAPPQGLLTTDEWWFAIKTARQRSYQQIPLRATDARPFVYVLPGAAQKLLHRIDTDAAGSIAAPEQVRNPQTRDTYLIKTLVEEAITSSQLEGASTTRKVAKEMIQTGRKPRDRSERMIANNYEAMQFIRRFIDEPLTPAIILELHAILTKDTLDDPAAAGRLRRSDEQIHVEDEVGRTLHIPPKASELKDRIWEMCAFANDRESVEFVHPVVRAIMIHFWLAYDHPFVDGNGRTARALFYWSMASQGYWLCEFLSISRILKKARGQYGRAFLFTETDDNDATYFILFQLRVIAQAITALHEYLGRRAAQIHETEGLINSERLRARLNYRQIALLHHAIKKGNVPYTFASHGRAHGVSYGSARSDLLDLVQMKMLEVRKIGRAFSFHAPSDLRARLASVNSGRRVKSTV